MTRKFVCTDDACKDNAINYYRSKRVAEDHEERTGHEVREVAGSDAC